MINNTTTKVQFQREVDGNWEDVVPITSEECVVLDDGRKLSEALQDIIYVELDSDNVSDGLVTADNEAVVTKDGRGIEVLGANGSTTISELQEKLVIADTDVFIVEDQYYTRKATKASLLREVNGRVSTLEERLGQLDEAINPLNISLSINPNTAERGSTVSVVNVSWSYNRDIRSQTLNGELLDSTIRSMKDTSPTTVNKTYILSATSSTGQTKSKNATLTFMNGVYYGVSSQESYDSAFIRSLTKTLSDSRSRTITVTANTEDYIYYCVPTRLGNCTFAVGGFTGGFSKVETIDFTNQFNYTEKYDIWKSDNKGLGTTKITIS